MAQTQTHNYTHPISGFQIKFNWNNGKKPPQEIVRKAFDDMDFNGELAFDDLTTGYDFSERYSNDLQLQYNDVETPVKELQEKDFEYWNQIEFNLAQGGMFAMQDMSQLPVERRQALWRRFNAYDRTKATGDGSRDFIEQAKGVGAAVGTDLTNLFAGGVVKNLVQKTAGKGALRWMVRNVLFPGAGAATWGTLSDAERQIIEMNLNPSQEFDFSRLGMTAAVSAAGGTLMKPLLLGTGKTLKFLTNPKAGITEGYESILDVLGASGVAKDGVVNEASTAFGFSQPTFIKGIKNALEEVKNARNNKTPSGAEQARQANLSLSKELETADDIFKERYKSIGELKITTKEIDELYQNIKKAGIKEGKLPNLDFLINRMKRSPGNVAIKGDELTPTEVIRRMRRLLGDATYDPNNSNIADILKFHNEKARTKFSFHANKIGKGKEVTILDNEFSEFQTLNRAIKTAAEEESKAQNLIQSIITNPTKSSILVNDYLKDIQLLGKRSGNKDLVENHKELLRNTLNENLFEKGGFLKYFRTASGRETLQELYPEANDLNMDRWSTILANADGKGTAAVFWGRLIAGSMGAGIGAGGGGFFGGAAGAGAGIIALQGLLKSPQFEKAVMNAYSKKGSEKAIGKIEKMLIAKKIPENEITYILRAINGDIPAAQLTKQAVTNIPEETKESLNAVWGTKITERTSD
tara:strand:+ start:631 stop:2718 length:2088 start_codon:yes stop_codon:yes gene_type:complete